MLAPSEVDKISCLLERYHEAFYIFWTLSDIRYTDETEKDITTAAVYLTSHNNSAKPVIVLNEKFWNSQTDDEKAFVVIHECLHILLNHGFRSGMHLPGATAAKSNIAQDITINHLIVNTFKLPRIKIRDWAKYCWVDTVFPDEIVSEKETYLFYLKKLINESPTIEVSLVDMHLMMGGIGDETSSAIEDLKEKLGVSSGDAADIVEKILGAMQDGEIKDISQANGQQAGTISSTLKARLDAQKPKKVSFDKMIRHLKMTSISYKDRIKESFAVENRRYSDFTRRSGAILPGNHEYTLPDQNCLLTAVFLDVSGSCVEYQKDFFKIAKAFDSEKKLFNLNLYTFDTRVAKVHIGDRIWAGGGTAFDIIERQLQTEFKTKHGRYPDVVFVITDGYGNRVTPEMPKRWVWLATSGFTSNYVDPKSKVYKLSEVVFE